MEERQTCGDECVIDLSKYRERAAERKEEAEGGTLILLTHGTYGHHDDCFSAIQVGNALLAEDSGATIALLDDGVYFGVKDQNSAGLGLPNNLKYVEDFLDLGGRILALRSALERRGLAPESLFPGIEVIEEPRLAEELRRHRNTLTF